MRTRMIGLSLLSIFIAAISWLMNFGFMKLFLSMMLIPVAHAVVVFAVGALASHYACSQKMRFIHMLFCLTYVWSYVFFPDVDESSYRVFFGLIENTLICHLAGIVSIVAFIAHVVLFIMQFMEIKRIDRMKKDL